MNQLKGESYKETPLGDSLIGFASSLVPQCGHAGVATILPIVVASVLADAGVETVNSRGKVYNGSLNNTH